MSPRAVEGADIFSLGSTTFLLLEEIGLERTPGLGNYSRTQRRWTGKSADIPQEWKDNVSACMVQDANDRLTLANVQAFWETQWKTASCGRGRVKTLASSLLSLWPQLIGLSRLR